MAIEYRSQQLTAGFAYPDTRTLAAVNNDSSNNLTPGRFVLRDGVTGVPSAKQNQSVLPVLTANETALVRTLTPSSYTAGQMLVSGMFRGRPFVIPSTFDTDLGTTLDNIVVLINEYFDDNYTAGASIIAANSGDTALTLTAEVAGEWFTAQMVVEGGTVAPTANAGTHLLARLSGVVLQDGSELDTDGTTAIIKPNHLCTVAWQRRVSVELDVAGAVTPETVFYIDTATGKATTTSDSTAVWVPPGALQIVSLETPADGTLTPTTAVAQVEIDITRARGYLGSI